MGTMKKVLAILMLVVMTASMVACSKGTEGDAGKSEGNTAGDVNGQEDGQADGTDDATNNAPEKVVLGLIAQAFGTQSFNDDVLAGLELAKTELGVETFSIEVPEVSDAPMALRTLIDQGANFIVIPDGGYVDAMLEVTEEYPDVKFLYAADTISGYSNIMSMVYRENEASFLAGALGALMTQSNNIGAVMGVGDDVQYRYQYGFMAGAKAVNPDCEVQTAFTGSYTDVNKGAEVAKAMYSKGADFIGTYSGAGNLGVFNSADAAGEGKYCFGAANGQFDKMPNKIVASVVKPVDQAIYSIVKDYMETGNFDTSKPFSLGLKEGGVVLKFTTNEELLKVIPEDVMNTMNDLVAKIESGEIAVPGTEQEYVAFDYTYTK